MLPNMKKRAVTTHWTHIGTLAMRLAGKLMAQREDKISGLERDGAVTAPGTGANTSPTVGTDRSDVGGTRCGFGRNGRRAIKGRQVSSGRWRVERAGERVIH